jgi:hypothetical protein
MVGWIAGGEEAASRNPGAQSDPSAYTRLAAGMIGPRPWTGNHVRDACAQAGVESG